jgi:hypothetical protein
MVKAKRKRVNAGEALYRKLRRAGPGLSDADVSELEGSLNDPRQHIWRRAAFGTAMMSGKDLFGKIEADRESAVVFAEMAIGVRDYVKRVRALADLIDMEQVRIELALCAREDCEEVRAEAKKEYAAEPRI